MDEDPGQFNLIGAARSRGPVKRRGAGRYRMAAAAGSSSRTTRAR